MPTSPSDPPPKPPRCYYCDAALEPPTVLPDSRQIRIDLGLGDWGRDADPEPQRCGKCGALQPWAQDAREPQKAETD